MDVRNWCIRALPNREFEVRDKLNAKGLQVHLAERIVRIRTNSRKWREEVRPVLPGYMRVTCTDDQWHEIGRCMLVRGSIVQPMVPDIFPMSRKDVDDFKRLEAQAERGDFDPGGPLHHIKAGQVMDVIGGVFDGLRFSFDRVRGDRVVGQIETLTGKMRAELSVDDLDWRAV